MARKPILDQEDCSSQMMEQKSDHYYDSHKFGFFSAEEYQVCETLLSLETIILAQEKEEEEEEEEKSRGSIKIRIRCKRNNIIHSESAVTSTQNENQNPNNNNIVVVINNPPPVPEFPPVLAGLRNYVLECCRMPFEKQLKESDLKKDQNRLLLGKKHVETYFLPLLRGGEEDVKEGIQVMVYDVEGNTFNMTFKLWANKYYVLMSGWKAFFTAHDLQMLQDHITVWMFRHSETNKLCFALAVRRGEGRAEEEEEGA